MADLVSIVTPTYNSAKFIAETVASVQAQTYPHWEMIIVDDGSKDDTVAVLNQLANADPRIRVIVSPENIGPARARNLGIDQVQGRYMTFLDADDIWFPHLIANSISAIRETQIPFVFSSYRRSNEKLEFVYSDFIVPKKVTYTDILKTNSISCLTAFLDINVLGKKWMPVIQKRQDMGLWLQYLKQIPYAYGIQTPQAIYRIRENSLSRQKSKLIKYQWQFYREIEKLSVISSIYYMVQWMVRGYFKYRN